MQEYELARRRSLKGRASFRSLVIAQLAMASLTLVGCGSSDRPKTIPITGQVTIDGQAPNEFGKLFFTPTAAADGYNKRPASGSFGLDGKYRVMSWAPDDGLVPGHYTVAIMAADASVSKFPAKYFESGTSGLEVDVPVDQEEINFDIKVITK